jgi:hypothetical protein
MIRFNFKPMPIEMHAHRVRVPTTRAARAAELTNTLRMQTTQSLRRRRWALRVPSESATVSCIAIIMALTFMGTGCSERPAFTQLMDARRSTAELQVRFTKSVDAANRAVMADTDEASVAFAHEAEEQTQAAQRELVRLDGIVRSRGYADETTPLKAFRDAFEKSRTLDREVLGLAVENTNLKAQRLSFGPAHEAANMLRAALDAIANSVPTSDAFRAKALATSTLSAIREIEVLQGPHIAASEDATMTDLERQMASLETEARGALRELASLHVEQPAATAANNALTRFMAINAQLVALSRRNSNVRSLQLSLGKKRTLAGVCEDSLHALSDQLAKRDTTATR